MAATQRTGANVARAGTPAQLNVTKTGSKGPEPPRTPGGSSLAAAANASLTSFTSSKRFLKFCNDAFTTCDVDNSGSIDSGELFAAILLLNHHLNGLPLGKKQLPPTRERVTKLFEAHSRGKSSMTREGFIEVCQELCTELATGVPRNMFIVFVMCPVMASGAKTFLLKTIGHIHHHVEFAVTNVPDSLFVPIATSVLTVMVPMLIAKHDDWAHKRAAASKRKARVGVSRTEQMMGLLLALLLPLFFALAWPFLEPHLDMLVGDQARQVHAVVAPYLAPVTDRIAAIMDHAAGVVGPVPWLTKK